MGTAETVPILARIEREGGHTLPPSQSPMRVQALPHGFVCSPGDAKQIYILFSYDLSSCFSLAWCLPWYMPFRGIT